MKTKRDNIMNTLTFEPPQKWAEKSHFDAAISHPWYRLLFDLSSTITFATYQFFQEKGYSAALAPVTCNAITSPMGLGSDSLPVKINLFGEPTYLADSMQFHLEYLLRHGKKGVFYIMPSFRGEDPDRRHLNQFFHIEAEIIGDLGAVIQCINEYLFYIIELVYKRHYESLIRFNRDTSHIDAFLKNKSPIFVPFKEAKAILKHDPRYFNFYEKKIVGLNHLGETTLMQYLGDAIWLTHLPRIGVPFYQADTVDDSDSALAADFLAGIGEMIGCGERHQNVNSLINAMNARNVSPAEYEWYIQLKRDYPLKTSGFGIGFERMLLWILKHDDIRDIPIIQRLKNNISFP